MAYSEPDAYSEPWHIQNPGVFRTLAYSEPCQTSTMQHFAKIVNGYNYFRNISISCSLLYEKNVNFYHAGLIFTPELFIWCKINMWPEGTRGREFLISLFLISSKLAYLQIITVLIYGSSPPKSHEQNYLNCLQNPWKLHERGFLFWACNFTNIELLGFCLKFQRVSFIEHVPCL